MVIREWRARAAESNPHGYPSHFRKRVLPELLQTPGFLGAQLSKRKVNRDIEFQVFTQWESIEAIRRFAGSDIEKAVVEPGAVAELLSFDSTVKHYEVIENVRRPPEIDGDSLG
ncbi:MAG: antibiotic biosynthesis monooxygenase [Rhizomicrobium sp.]